jgi:hypothetical protein
MEERKTFVHAANLQRKTSKIITRRMTELLDHELDVDVELRLIAQNIASADFLQAQRPMSTG